MIKREFDGNDLFEVESVEEVMMILSECESRLGSGLSIVKGEEVTEYCKFQLDYTMDNLADVVFLIYDCDLTPSQFKIRGGDIRMALNSDSSWMVSDDRFIVIDPNTNWFSNAIKLLKLSQL